MTRYQWTARDASTGSYFLAVPGFIYEVRPVGHWSKGWTTIRHQAGVDKPPVTLRTARTRKQAKSIAEGDAEVMLAKTQPGEQWRCRNCGKPHFRDFLQYRSDANHDGLCAMCIEQIAEDYWRNGQHPDRVKRGQR
jgi:predicted heme/steroid binding protein